MRHAPIVLYGVANDCHWLKSPTKYLGKEKREKVLDLSSPK